jgi:hypothetical protein
VRLLLLFLLLLLLLAASSSCCSRLTTTTTTTLQTTTPTTPLPLGSSQTQRRAAAHAARTRPRAPVSPASFSGCDRAQDEREGERLALAPGIRESSWVHYPRWDLSGVVGNA